MLKWARAASTSPRACSVAARYVRARARSSGARSGSSAMGASASRAFSNSANSKSRTAASSDAEVWAEAGAASRDERTNRQSPRALGTRDEFGTMCHLLAGRHADALAVRLTVRVEQLERVGAFGERERAHLGESSIGLAVVLDVRPTGHAQLDRSGAGSDWRRRSPSPGPPGRLGGLRSGSGNGRRRGSI